ncbi:hypothetical protein [Cohaesibacter gelatinilyticus]|nr:hypothetical protein [Cohaesibacter gelatinilyticus]
MWPADIAGMISHGKRKGGDLDHCDQGRLDDTQWLIGGYDFAKTIHEEIATYSEENLEEELLALEKIHRKSDMKKRLKDGLKDPFRDSKQGPLREVILTANGSYFAADNDDPDPYLAHTTTKEGDRQTVRLCRKKIAAFKEAGLEFFGTYFPEQVRHLRLDMDEEVPHFHALVLVTKVRVSKRRGKQTMITPSANPLFQSYELLQDKAGEFFSSIGLERGQRSAEERRKAKEFDLPVPEKREHVAPQDHRAARAEDLRKREEVAKETEAGYLQRWLEIDRYKEEAKREAETILSDSRLEADRIIRVAEKKKTEAEERYAEVEQIRKEQEKEMDRYEVAFEKGIDAVDDGKIIYRPASKTNKKDGLNYGPNAPQDAAEREAFAAPIRRASDVIKKYARRIWNSDLAQCERAIQADPSLVDVSVSYDPDKTDSSDEIVQVELKGVDRLPRSVAAILRRIAKGAAKRIGNHIGALIDRKADEKARVAIAEANKAKAEAEKLKERAQEEKDNFNAVFDEIKEIRNFAQDYLNKGVYEQIQNGSVTKVARLKMALEAKGLAEKTGSNIDIRAPESKRSSPRER